MHTPECIFILVWIKKIFFTLEILWHLQYLSSLLMDLTFQCL